jgi:hypothetical protein
MAVRNLKPVPLYLKPEQHRGVKSLSAKTRVPMQAYFREAVDDLLKKYERTRK